MGKTDFLDALRRAMAGIAPQTQATTLAYYEQRFIDGVDGGKTEAAVAAELDDPRKIALTLRTSMHMQAFEKKRHPANFIRMAFAAVGLLVFNLVMVVPAVVYAALLACMYAFGLAMYLYGVVITASGLSGTTEFNLDGPFSNHEVTKRGDDGKVSHEVTQRQTKVAISGANIQIYSEPVPEAALADEERDEERRAMRALRRAEQIATIGIKFNADLDEASRATQSVLGFGLVLGGIVLLLLSLVVTRYTLVGARRYVEMNFSLLKGN
jgi:uncharacterized membrane protein